ncbi:MAG: hypothetical protein DHS20C13_26150 [Thermodesulfobacteriota bacterium]|nr:MAG: hypothetical protein DHS20C13_26150 [Thermodesulfobacteriota bacterium]
MNFAVFNRFFEFDAFIGIRVVFGFANFTYKWRSIGNSQTIRDAWFLYFYTGNYSFVLSEGESEVAGLTGLWIGHF